MALRPAIVRLALIQVGLVVAIGTGLWFSYPAWRLGQTSERLRREFPDVAMMTTRDLGNWLRSPDSSPPLILDVRGADEFQVSHLIGAERVDAEGALKKDTLPEDLGRAIVVVCSTGERSCAFARRLLQAGHRRVSVVEGGLVKWANEGRPLTDGQKLVTRLHGDTEVSRLLKRAHRTASPGPH